MGAWRSDGPRRVNMIRFFSFTSLLLLLLHENQVSCIERERDTLAKVICFLILSFFVYPHPTAHPSSSPPYVLEHLEQTFFFFFFIGFFFLLRLRQKKLGDQQLAVFLSHLHCIGCCSRIKSRVKRTAHTLMVPHCEEGTRRIYYMSYVREQAILSFTHRTEQESKKKKKRLPYVKNKSSGLHTCVLSIGKREKKKEKQRPNFIHSFIEEKTQMHKKKKISRFFYGISTVIFFLLYFLAYMLI